MTSYQKLKQRVSELDGEVNTLVFEPESMDAIQIRARRNMDRRITEAVLMGSRGTYPDSVVKEHATTVRR